MSQVSHVLSKEDCEAISVAVRDAESKTSGQIATAVIPASDRYPGAKWRLGITVALIGGAIILVEAPHWSAIRLFFIEIAFMILGTIIAESCSWIKRLFVHQREITEEVRQRALEMFYQSGAGKTQQRNGILILISLFEHRIELLADEGIHSKVAQKDWDEIVAHLTHAFQKKKIREGLCDAVKSSGELLSKYYPPNGLSNSVGDAPITC